MRAINPRRHRRDFLILAGLITAADFAEDTLSKKDRQRLRGMLAALDKDREMILDVAGAPEAVARVRLAADLA